MGGHWIPPEIYSLTPVYRSFFEHDVTAQFNHRVLVSPLRALRFFGG
jgi:hypothetical protein